MCVFDRLSDWDQTSSPNLALHSSLKKIAPFGPHLITIEADSGTRTWTQHKPPDFMYQVEVQQIPKALKVTVSSPSLPILSLEHRQKRLFAELHRVCHAHKLAPHMQGGGFRRQGSSGRKAGGSSNPPPIHTLSHDKRPAGGSGEGNRMVPLKPRGPAWTSPQQAPAKQAGQVRKSTMVKYPSQLSEEGLGHTFYIVWTQLISHIQGKAICGWHTPSVTNSACFSFVSSVRICLLVCVTCAMRST